MKKAYNVNVKAEPGCGDPTCDCREVLAMFPSVKQCEDYIATSPKPLNDPQVGATEFELIETYKNYQDAPPSVRVTIVRGEADLDDLLRKIFGE